MYYLQCSLLIENTLMLLLFGQISRRPDQIKQDTQQINWVSSHIVFIKSLYLWFWAVFYPEERRELISRKLHRRFQHIVLSLSTVWPGSTQAQLGCGLVLISQIVSGGNSTTYFLIGAPSAAHCFSAAHSQSYSDTHTKQCDRKTLTWIEAESVSQISHPASW